MGTKYGLTETYLQEQIKETSYQRYGDTGTLCVLTLKNGYTVTGTSGCIDPTIFAEDIGERIAFDNAFNKLWEILGYGEKQRWYEEVQLSWKERVELEFRQLDDRLSKLHALLFQADGVFNPRPEFIAEAQWELMKSQHTAMKAYSDILLARLNNA